MRRKTQLRSAIPKASARGGRMATSVRPSGKYDVLDLLASTVLLFPPIALDRVSKGIIVEGFGEKFNSVQFLPDAVQFQNSFNGLTCIVLPVRLEIKREDTNGLRDRQLGASQLVPRLMELFGIKKVSALGLNFSTTFRATDVDDAGRTIIERYTHLGRVEELAGLKFGGVGLRLAFSKDPYAYDFKFEPWFREPKRFFAAINIHQNDPSDATLRVIDDLVSDQYTFFDSLINSVLSA